ncbi:lipoprotein [Spiroplasma endosymbiont of Glossina fuscipes fuscipes]|uniref:lipoprotein n=1 Tax=Spiroplasma endosymbiont of Glossina fuscipes fuscipes TaxID=2004463 RepID=UPI003C768F46
MKRILALLGVISLVGTSAVSVVACSHPQNKVSVDDIKKELEQYTDTPFFASSSQITNVKLASELASRMTLGSYKLVVKDDTTFVEPNISDGNTVLAQSIADFKTQLAELSVKGQLVVNNGSAVVSLQKKDSELFSVKIKWSTNELLFLASTINFINGVGETTQNIKFSLPPIIPELDINLADLYSFLSVIQLPEELINSINLAEINNPNSDFVSKFNAVLKDISDSLGVLGLGDFLTKDASFTYQIVKDEDNDISFVGAGTVKDLLHNFAPDLIALLQWYIKEGKQKIEATHNTVLPLIQYLFSPVNNNVKENIKTEFGEANWFYTNTATNFDSLVFHLLSDYKSKPTEEDNHYIFKVVGKIKYDTGWEIKIPIPLDFVMNQNLLGDEGPNALLAVLCFKLNPTLLLTSILDVFGKNEGKGIDAVGESILQPKQWQGINDFITDKIPGINVYLGPSIMDFAGPAILRNLGLSSTEIDNNNITMIAGTVKLQFKNSNNEWENFTTILVKNGDKMVPNLTQILKATDVKISFMNVQFKVTLKDNNKIVYETNGNVNFDLWLSDLMN